MKLDTNTLLILLGGGLALFWFMKKDGGGGGVDDRDLAIMAALRQQQASAEANQQAMFKIISEMKQKAPGTDPWENPETYARFLDIGVDLVGAIGSFV